MFCCEFGNVVNHTFIVLIFGVKNPVGASFKLFATMSRPSVKSVVEVSEGFYMLKNTFP